MLLPNFMGQVGMRIMQRPQGAAVFKDEDGNFDKTAMDKFMNKYILKTYGTLVKIKTKIFLNILNKVHLRSFLYENI